MPISAQQERWEVYAVAGTKATVRGVLRDGESLSEFVRAAVDAEVTRRSDIVTAGPS